MKKIPQVEATVKISKKLDENWISNEELFSLLKEMGEEALKEYLVELVMEDLVALIDDAKIDVKIKVKCRHEYENAEIDGLPALRCKICGKERIFAHPSLLLGR